MELSGLDTKSVVLRSYRRKWLCLDMDWINHIRMSRVAENVAILRIIRMVGWRFLDELLKLCWCTYSNSHVVVAMMYTTAMWWMP